MKRHPKGVLIIATGHEQYLHMAFNCAVSIKCHDMSAHVTLALSDNLKQLILSTPVKMNFVDGIVDVPEDMYVFKGNTEHGRVKTFMYELSPYEKTIYLDADSLFLGQKSLESLFEYFNGNPVAFQFQHSFDIQTSWGCLWTVKPGNPEPPNEGLKEIREQYGIKDHRKIYETQSSIMYFDRSKKAEKFFAFARQAYDERPFHFYTWANGIPDELVFNIASAACKITPNKEPMKPVYFWDYDQNIYRRGNNRDAIYRDFWAISMAGNRLGYTMKDFYKVILQDCYYKYQNMLRFPVFYRDKAEFLAERHNA